MEIIQKLQFSCNNNSLFLTYKSGKTENFMSFYPKLNAYEVFTTLIQYLT